MNQLKTRHDLETLLHQLKSPDWTVQRQAEQMLHRLKDKEAILWLIDILLSEDEWLGEEAARLLGHLGARAAVPALGEVLRRDWRSETGLRIAAAQALAQMADPAAEPDLTLVATDPEEKDVYIQPYAILALAKIGTATAIQTLTGLLRHEKGCQSQFFVRVCDVAAQALDQIPDDQAQMAAKTHWEQLVRHVSPYIRATLAEYLWHLRRPAYNDLLEQLAQDEAEVVILRKRVCDVVKRASL